VLSAEQQLKKENSLLFLEQYKEIVGQKRVLLRDIQIIFDKIVLLTDPKNPIIQ